MSPVGFRDKVAFVWKVADKLRGTFKLARIMDRSYCRCSCFAGWTLCSRRQKQAVLDAAAGMNDIGRVNQPSPQEEGRPPVHTTPHR